MTCDYCGVALALADAHVNVDLAPINRGEGPGRWFLSCARCPDPEPFTLYHAAASDILDDYPLREHLEGKTWFADTIGFGRLEGIVAVAAVKGDGRNPMPRDRDA